MTAKDFILLAGTGAVGFLILLLLFRLLKKGAPLGKWYFWLSWIFVTPSLYYVVILILITYSFQINAEFNRELWLKDKEQRVLMIDDLISKRLLEKKSKDEVYELLGVPEESSPYFQSTDREAIYYLGRERGINSVDSEWLLIWFNEGKVSRYQVATD